MAYVTNADIEKRLGSQAYVQLTDDDGDGVADLGVVDEARLGAEGEVNSYLARRYSVPVDLSAHPELADLLTSITLDLLEYRLRLRRPPVPQDVASKNADTVDWLKHVAAGRIDMPSAATVAANAARGIIAATTGAQRVLSREELSDH